MTSELHVILWIASALLSLLYLIAGGTKVVTSKDRLQRQPRMAYIHDRTAMEVKAIGGIEVLGAIGVLAPQLTGILPWLSVVAAFALAIVQVVAILVHLRRGEHALAFNIVLLVLALLVGVGLLVA
jgi:uncharacterized membrane protein YkgB